MNTVDEGSFGQQILDGGQEEYDGEFKEIDIPQLPMQVPNIPELPEKTFDFNIPLLKTVKQHNEEGDEVTMD